MTDPREAFRAAILRDLGAAPDHIEPGDFERFPTSGRRGDDAGFCKLFDDQQGGVYGCHRQFPRQVFTWTGSDRSGMTPTQRAALARQIEQATRERLQAQRQQWQRNAARLAALWAQCVSPAPGGPVAAYLARRLRCAVPTPACVREHPALPYRVDGVTVGTWPAMVARLESPAGELLALHRTWLTPDGRKAPTPGAVKKLTPTAGPTDGACIPLAAPAHGRLGIAEGIETALAARCGSGVPTVAAYSAGALAAWRWPRALRRLDVFADADPAGADAAVRLARRAQAAGLAVHIHTPTEPGTDWCDVWAQRDLKEASA